jgi:hypothetical protein
MALADLLPMSTGTNWHVFPVMIERVQQHLAEQSRSKQMERALAGVETIDPGRHQADARAAQRHDRNRPTRALL